MTKSELLQREFLDTSDFSAQQAIYLVKVSSVKIPLPTLEEQVEIAAFCEIKSSKIDEAVRTKMQQIKTLKEYKTTLINAAVTGKIKVA